MDFSVGRELGRHLGLGGGITREELDATIADPSTARGLLLLERRWHVFPPGRDEYIKEGMLGTNDGFEDYGTGGKTSY